MDPSLKTALVKVMSNLSAFCKAGPEQEHSVITGVVLQMLHQLKTLLLPMAVTGFGHDSYTQL